MPVRQVGAADLRPQARQLVVVRRDHLFHAAILRNGEILATAILRNAAPGLGGRRIAAALDRIDDNPGGAAVRELTVVLGKFR